MKAKLFLFFLLFISFACRRSVESATPVPIPSNTPPVVISESDIMSSGEKRHFLLYVPTTYHGDPTALIFNFHGYGSNGVQEERLTGMSTKADEAGFIVVYPDGVQATWHTGLIPQGDADRQFVLDLINHISTLYNIDTKRIYATGMSNGGGMTNRVACSMADVFAAVAPNAGAYSYWQQCSPSRPIPVLAFHGTEDKIVPYEGSKQQEIVPSIEVWASAWAERNECDSIPIINISISTAPTITTPDITTSNIASPIDTTVTTRAWTNCKENADVILYTLAGHGHTLPGTLIDLPTVTSRAINATDVIWDFFVEHPMP